ncbi:MAG TPA: hypothetical protein VK742_14515 [Candidatus Sulfotelmatobacter sp.]|nr:hypothetical protein [Candidatus Sulfotelmatobacter sp.]
MNGKWPVFTQLFGTRIQFELTGFKFPRPPIEIPIRQCQYQQHATKRNHRANGQINAASDDDQSYADAENAAQPDEVGGIGEIGPGKKARILEAGHRA